MLFYKLFRPQIGFEANVRDFWTQTSQNRLKWLQQWLIRGQHRIRRCRFTPGSHRYASEAIHHVLRLLPASSVRRGLLGWVGLPSENTARISGYNALEPSLSLLAGERGSELVCRFLGLIPRLMRWLSAARACVKLSLAWSAALSACCVCELVPGPPDGLLSLPVRRSRAFDPGETPGGIDTAKALVLTGWPGSAPFGVSLNRQIQIRILESESSTPKLVVQI